MRLRHLRLPLVAAFAAFVLSAPARAELLVEINKSIQQMTVTVDGVPRYTWPVSTGGSGYDTPGGEYTPFRMEKDHFSKEWDDAPMPNSIFFTKVGHAIHGTFEAKNLGKPVSHGCVRLSRANSEVLWGLVKAQTMKNTKVVLTGEIPGGGVPMARRAPRYDNGYGYGYGNGYGYGEDAAQQRLAPPPGWRGYSNGQRDYYYREQPYPVRRYNGNQGYYQQQPWGW
jgi:hypothetical protein